MKEGRSDTDENNLLRTNDGSNDDEQSLVKTCESTVAEYEVDLSDPDDSLKSLMKKCFSLEMKTKDIKKALIFLFSSVLGPDLDPDDQVKHVR